MEVDEDLLKQESENDKQREIEMLQEFERRRRFKAAYDSVDKVDQEMGAENEHRMKEQKQQIEDETERKANFAAALMPDESKGELYDSK